MLRKFRAQIILFFTSLAALLISEDVAEIRPLVYKSRGFTAEGDLIGLLAFDLYSIGVILLSLTAVTAIYIVEEKKLKKLILLCGLILLSPGLSSYNSFAALTFFTAGMLNSPADFTLQENRFESLYLGGLLLYILLYFQPMVIIFTIIAFLAGIYLRKLEIAEKALKVLRDQSYEEILRLKESERRARSADSKKREIDILAERERISTELHDVIGHSISASILQLEAEIILNKDEERKKGLRLVQSRLSEGMSEIRKVLHMMKRESFDLQKKIEAAAAIYPERKVYVKAYDGPDLPMSFKLEILNMAKEGINNFYKYSKADELLINFTAQRSFYSLEISDDGGKEFGSDGRREFGSNGESDETVSRRIFGKDELSGGRKFGAADQGEGAGQVAEKPDEGIGLLSMREAAERYGGIFKLDRTKGFRIYMTFKREKVLNG